MKIKLFSWPMSRKVRFSTLLGTLIFSGAIFADAPPPPPPPPPLHPDDLPVVSQPISEKLLRPAKVVKKAKKTKTIQKPPVLNKPKKRFTLNDLKRYEEKHMKDNYQKVTAEEIIEKKEKKEGGMKPKQKKFLKESIEFYQNLKVIEGICRIQDLKTDRVVQSIGKSNWALYVEDLYSDFKTESKVDPVGRFVLRIPPGTFMLTAINSDGILLKKVFSNIYGSKTHTALDLNSTHIALYVQSRWREHFSKLKPYDLSKELRELLKLSHTADHSSLAQGKGFKAMVLHLLKEDIQRSIQENHVQKYMDDELRRAYVKLKPISLSGRINFENHSDSDELPLILLKDIHLNRHHKLEVRRVMGVLNFNAAVPKGSYEIIAISNDGQVYMHLLPNVETDTFSIRVDLKSTTLSLYTKGVLDAQEPNAMTRGLLTAESLYYAERDNLVYFDQRISQQLLNTIKKKIVAKNDQGEGDYFLEQAQKDHYYSFVNRSRAVENISITPPQKPESKPEVITASKPSPALDTVKKILKEDHPWWYNTPHEARVDESIKPKAHRPVAQKTVQRQPVVRKQIPSDRIINVTLNKVQNKPRPVIKKYQRVYPKTTTPTIIRSTKAIRKPKVIRSSKGIIYGNIYDDAKGRQRPKNKSFLGRLLGRGS